MKTAGALLALACIAALAASPHFALAQDDDDDDGPTIEPVYDIAIDLDNDGKLDRVAVVQHQDSAGSDLYVYLGQGDEKLDLTRKPDLFKKDIATERVADLEPGGEGSLLLTYGCGGCSNDYETTLTIVYRGGKFLVAGFTQDWDTRDGIGSCDINFLTGQAVASRGLEDRSTAERKFKPVKLTLADWSEDDGAVACGFAAVGR
jgi:hypothetical protein